MILFLNRNFFLYLGVFFIFYYYCKIMVLVKYKGLENFRLKFFRYGLFVFLNLKEYNFFLKLKLKCLLVLCFLLNLEYLENIFVVGIFNN